MIDWKTLGIYVGITVLTASLILGIYVLAFISILILICLAIAQYYDAEDYEEGEGCELKEEDKRPIRTVQWKRKEAKLKCKKKK